MSYDMPALPWGARVFPLRAGSKQPANSNGHLGAIRADVIPGQEIRKPGNNYGIALDGQFLVVDVDYPNLLTPEFKELPGTWTQLTQRGSHKLFRVPQGFKGKNTRLPNEAGDIKVNGYIVGPGSVVDGFTYSIFNPQDPADAPEWLLGMVADTRQSSGERKRNGDAEALQIKEGEGRNQFLTKAAGSLRRLGLGVGQVKEVVRSINSRTCSPPVEEVELRNTVDKSIEKWQQGKVVLDGPFVSSGWIKGSDVPLIEPPVSWWEWGFVPKGVLVLQYGRGGIGKSTLAAWLAGKVTTSGGRFGVITREDPFRLFAIRSKFSGANLDLLWAPKSGDMLFPRDGDKLHQIVKDMQLDFLYFDSIYDHFEPVKDSNMAERARSSLSPLANIATDTGCTILGTFHTNKSGRFMGSTEMENVARILLETTRGDSPDAPLTVGVEKSNFKRPDYKLQFLIKTTELIDPTTGEVQMEEQENGTMGQAKFSYADKVNNVREGYINIDSVNEWNPVDELFSDAEI